jgi:hypothetical protein
MGVRPKLYRLLHECVETGVRAGIMNDLPTPLKPHLEDGVVDKIVNRIELNIDEWFTFSDQDIGVLHE